MEELKVYGVDEVAKLMKVTERTVYDYIKSGSLKAVKFGKYWKITEDNLRGFLETGYTA